MKILKKKIIKKKFKKRGGVGCPLLLLRNETLGCQKVDKHTDSPDLKYKKLFYDLCNLFVDNSNLSSDRKNSVKDNLKKHIKSIKPCNNDSYKFIIMINGIIVDIRIKFDRNCRVSLLINYNANIHFTMFSDLNESKGYKGCCSPFHLTINNPKTRAYINFEYSENLDCLADAIDATGYYIKYGKTRSTDEPVSDSWTEILRNIDRYGATYRDTFKDFCDRLREYIIRENSRESSDFYRHARSPGRPSSDRRVRSPTRDRSPRRLEGNSGYRRSGRSRSPRRGFSGYNEGDGRYREADSSRRSSGMRSPRSRSPLRGEHRGGGNLLNKKIIDSINKYFDKIKKIKKEIKILKKKKNKKKIEEKKNTIKNTLVKIKLKKEKLKKLKQKQKK